MKPLFALLAAAVLIAHAPTPAQAQDRGWRGAQGQKQGFAPRERAERGEMRRERMEDRERQRERRFTPEEREKLRQDLIDANRDLRRR